MTQRAMLAVQASFPDSFHPFEFYMSFVILIGPEPPGLFASAVHLPERSGMHHVLKALLNECMQVSLSCQIVQSAWSGWMMMFLELLQQ